MVERVKYTNYFELFDMPISCANDKENVMEKYYKLSKIYHPDRRAKDASISEEEELELSAAINKAKNIFLHKEKTIEYILLIKGKLQTKDEKLPPDFLMEMMELNERVDEAKTEKDADRLRIVEKEITDMERSLEEDILPTINSYRAGCPDEGKLLDELKTYYYKRKYIQRMRELIEKE